MIQPILANAGVPMIFSKTHEETRPDSNQAKISKNKKTKNMLHQVICVISRNVPKYRFI